MTTPNPGSTAALDAGCTCPVIDNHHGKGFPWGGGQKFWISGGCPVHAPVPAALRLIYDPDRVKP